MKHVKLNYRQMSLEKLEATGLTPQQAQTKYNRMYRQALSVAGRTTRENLNVAKELYASTLAPYSSTYVKSGLAVFELDSAKNKIELNTIYDKSSDIGVEKTMLKMDAFFKKFEDSPALQRIKNAYQDGKITRTEFNAKIKEWKQQSIKFMISGSK